MRDQGAKRGAALAELAARQHGVAALAQLRALGFDKRAVHRRAAAGRLHRVHRGCTPWATRNSAFRAVASLP
ncbi:MAG: type IV toxin-antitoxin system AbiEi family antitoxin domain-containing protein [Solirubrobacterales bacterium]